MSKLEPADRFDARDQEGRRHAARFWYEREKVEIEAASLFATLADQLDMTGPANLAALSRDGAKDELRHADQCRALVGSLDPQSTLAPVPRTRRTLPLGPNQGTPAERALYAAVALGCVTETLSVALLMEIQKRAEHEQVKQTAHEILRDEIRHSRLGWAYLEFAAGRGDVTWIGAHVPRMIRAALREELTATPGNASRADVAQRDEAPADALRGDEAPADALQNDEAPADALRNDEAPADALRNDEAPGSAFPEGSLEAFGVLGRGIAQRTCEAAIAQVVVPGLARVGIIVP